MRLWSEQGGGAHNRCCTPDAMAGARRVAAILGIPFYAVDAQQVFHERVVNLFMSGYLEGATPNPCLACNRYIRWDFLLKHARALGAEALATGHYARLRSDPEGRYQLLRALDADKDQSYALHVLGQEHLAATRFPLGGYTKAQVRQMAHDFGLPVAERADSQDLCFIGKGDYRDFLRRNAPQASAPGPILARDGRQLGQHLGLAFYTIGQRKGLGIAAPHPLYVLELDRERNALIVGACAELGCAELVMGQVNWISGRARREPFRAQVKIRYKSRAASATVTPLQNSSAHIRFDEPLRDITPGQAAVIYEDDICLGGGIIRTRGIPGGER
jgi:tRNA-specific 2-thiouridylase